MKMQLANLLITKIQHC